MKKSQINENSDDDELETFNNSEDATKLSSSSLTKTKAKKSIFLYLKKQNINILKEIKKKYPNANFQVMEKEAGEKKEKKYLVEFANYKEAKIAKDKLNETYDNELVEVNSGLHQNQNNPFYNNENSYEPRPKEFLRSDGNKNLFEIRMPKIILRNMSFRFNEDSLRKEMEKYGKVNLINMPKKEDGKYKGYAFVVFEDKKEASKAIDSINSSDKKIMGTKMAADWCLPKNIFLRNQNEPEKQEDTDEGDDENVDNDDEKQMDAEDEVLSESENDDSQDDEFGDEDDDKGEEDEEGEDDYDDEDDDDDEEDEKENSQKKASSKNKKKQHPKPEPVKKDPRLERKAKAGTQDVQEKRTVFVRNLSYDTTEDLVKEAFSKFGTVKYVKLCYDKELERPRGTGFVQFETNQSAIDACAESDILELDFRRLQIDLALPRTQAKELMDEKASSEKQKKDNRNLELAKEGVIYPNSSEALGISKADMTKRQNLEQEKANKLKLLHHFVSPTRLTVHNIPRSVTDDELRALFAKAIGTDRRYDIVKCRIMRDLTRLSADGVARSKGYGFIEFRNFLLAKKALHETNNNPNLFEKNNIRLIVQFSVENMKALKIQEQKLAKSKQRQKTLNASQEMIGKSPGATTDKKKQSGFHQPPVSLLDETDSAHKLRQRNLIKMDSLEKKLAEKKAEEDRKKDRKNERLELKNKKIMDKEEKLHELRKKLEMIKKEKKASKKERQKAKKAFQALTKNKKKNMYDDVDQLVERYQTKHATV